jgi:hypothetical protein
MPNKLSRQKEKASYGIARFLALKIPSYKQALSQG